MLGSGGDDAQAQAQAQQAQQQAQQQQQQQQQQQAAADGAPPAMQQAVDAGANGSDATAPTPAAAVPAKTDPEAAVPEAGAASGKATSEGVFGKLDFTPDFAALSKNRVPATLSWENIEFSINKRVVLKKVSGMVKYNETCALLGPSGAGKSSLLNILAGRMTSRGKKVITGNMFVNNEAVTPVTFRRHVSYVLQEDALFATATAREALEFSARLRLPRAVTEAERKKIVDELLRSLGLSHVANTMCGSEMVRGLSGGEKKRVSIGVELVTNPQILFLDEPTSGLDSYSAFQVISILKALSRSGCAVLCTIHQPSSEIFSLFDKAMVLAKGNMIYSGRVSHMPQLLDKAGFPLPELTNPADFVMVLAQTKSAEELPSIIDGENDVHEDRVSSSMLPNEHENVGFSALRTSSRFTQLKLLSLREFKNLGRDKGALFGRFGITIFLNLLFSWIFFEAGEVGQEGWTLNSHFGALTNMFISAMFGASQPPLLTFPLERVVFLREYSTGTYSSSPYFLSKLMVELPLYFVTSVIVLVIQYWLVGYQASFIILLLELFLIQVVSASYAFLIGALVSDVKQAQELAPLVFVPQLLFTGFFIKIEQIPESIRWVQYLCSLKYGLNLAMITEFGGSHCAPGGPIAVQQCNGLVAGNDVEDDLVWLYIVILLAIFVAFRTGSLVTLVWRAKNFTS